jgi:2'-5' RNA ligase
VLLDDRAADAVRRLWRRLEDRGVPTLLSHTHGRHLPHVTYASLRRYDVEAVGAALASLAAAPPLPLHFDALGSFRRSRCWLAPAVTSELVHRQARVVDEVAATGAELHHHYRPGSWVPHLTLASRLHLHQLPTVAAAVFDVLPLEAHGVRIALVETGTGTVHRLG